MDTIYVFELENNKFYVDKTNKPNIKTSEWLTKNKIIRVMNTFKSKTIFDENNITKELMMKYGIDNVRGGSYKNTFLNKQVIDVLNTEFTNINNSDDSYLDNFLTTKSIKKEISKLENIIKTYLSLNDKIYYCDIKITLYHQFKHEITPSIYDEYKKFVFEKYNVTSDDVKLHGTHLNINYATELLQKINNCIDTTFESLFPDSPFKNKSDSMFKQIKIKQIYLHNAKIAKNIESILSTKLKQFNDINEVYNTINILLDKQILLQDTEEDDGFFDDETSTTPSNVSKLNKAYIDGDELSEISFEL